MREGWKTQKLGELGKVITGSTPSTRDESNYSSPDVCFVKPSDIEKTGVTTISNTEFHISHKAFQQSRKLPKGSVLTTCIGIIGKVGILGVDATCNQQINAIIPDTGVVSSSFLAYSILSRQHLLSSIANAPVVPIINKGEFSSVLIPVPPIAEQEKIVAELDCLTGIIEKKRQQLEELDKLAQAIFYDMFGDPIANEKGWKMKKLGDVATVLDSKRKPITKSDRKAGVYPYYGATGIQDYVEGFIFDGRYLLLGEDGARWGAGDNSAFIIEGKSWVNNHAHVLQIGNGAKDVYIQYYLNICDLLQFVTGAVVPKLTQASMVRIPIMLPPLDLQDEFAYKVEAIEKQKELVKQSIVETETLFNSRMDYWFN